MSLGAAANGHYEALRSDLREAQDLSRQLERRLAEKSLHHSALTRAVEKTMSDLLALKTDLIALRMERHHLANEAMRATALEGTLRQREEQIGRLKDETADLRSKLGLPAAAGYG